MARAWSCPLCEYFDSVPVLTTMALCGHWKKIARYCENWKRGVRCYGNRRKTLRCYGNRRKTLRCYANWRKTVRSGPEDVRSCQRQEPKIDCSRGPVVRSGMVALRAVSLAPDGPRDSWFQQLQLAGWA